MDLSKCNTLKEPYIHIFTGDSDVIEAELNNNTIIKEIIVVKIINGSRCDNLKNLFNEFSRKLNFPMYFSGVWDSFEECINDLDWISGNGYILVINNAESVLVNDSKEMPTLYNILNDTAYEWAKGRCYDDFPTYPTSFHIILQCENYYESEIKKAFQKLKIQYSIIDKGRIN